MFDDLLPGNDKCETKQCPPHGYCVETTGDPVCYCDNYYYYDTKLNRCLGSFYYSHRIVNNHTMITIIYKKKTMAQG